MNCFFLDHRSLPQSIVPWKKRLWGNNHITRILKCSDPSKCTPQSPKSFNLEIIKIIYITFNESWKNGELQRIRVLVNSSSAEKILEITLIKEWGKPNVKPKEFPGMISLGLCQKIFRDQNYHLLCQFSQVWKSSKIFAVHLLSNIGLVNKGSYHGIDYYSISRYLV